MNTERATALSKTPLDDPLTVADSGPPGSPLAALLQAEEEFPCDGLGQALRQHRSTLIDYCTLALQPTLSTDDETRLGQILAQAVDDPLLSFWLDEADGWVGEQLQLLPEDLFKQQQGKLRRIIGQTWVDTLWHDLQHRTKALQAYLKRVGVYSGAIDGILGPRTQHAIESLKMESFTTESLKAVYPDDLPLGYL
ncbi:peptidoglycan-binding protein [Nodosilinea sp. LEGE 06152]|uniref:peptidoglycan-binding domain-containing protein n=1 Tax=Nodosilinea sp. LEGE 06152 TaxID=2777966 RepID=UPI00187E2F02|nr:peptidoglycan-binding domain-containing protein [Nodosilinea sp. LEGE 06152]MBE9158603.1 peptidoglycan-binding protein [Nodosilinea sp. LEGE 06152]